jgi:predicted transposase YbfD/YdcC
VVVVESLREKLPDPVTRELRLYITSRGPEAGKLGELIRGHWSVENQLHWQLDVSFGEDRSRTRKGHSAENQSRLRRLALMRLKQDTTYKVRIKAKRKAAGWSQDYLLKHLCG